MENLIKIFAQKAELALATPLKQKELLAFPIKLDANPSYTIDTADVTFSIGVGAMLEIALFNDDTDKDDDGLVATKDAVLTYDPNTEAYLKYATTLTAQASIGAAPTDVVFNLQSSLGLKSIFYKKHNNTDGIKDAFVADIQSFKTLFKFEDVENLSINDALYFKAATTLKSNLKISWPNILSQSLGSLTKYFPFLTLDFQLSSSLFAKFNVSLTDDLIYFIKKIDANNCLVSLNKTKKTSLDIAAGFKVMVGFANPAEINAQINMLFDMVCKSAFGYTRTEIDTAIAKTHLGAASSIQKTIIEKVMRCLKMNSLVDDINALATKWAAIETDIQASFIKIATVHAELSFTYQYSFIEENKELLSFTAPTTTLKNYHHNLLRFNTNDLLNVIRMGDKSIKLNSYLNQKTIDIKTTWGFGFKLFGFEIFGKDWADLKTITRTNLNNDGTQITLDYSRGYNWKLNKGNGTWLGELVARMDSFSSNPTLDQFNYSLQLSNILTDPNVGENDFREYLDSAVLWGAAGQSDVEKLFTTYNKAIIGQSVLVETKMVFSTNATKELINIIGGNGWNDLNKQYLAKAMAASMKYLSDFPLRATVVNRQNTYTGLWQAYLSDHQQDTSDFAATAADTIEKLPNNNNLSNHEQNDWNTFDYYFSSVIKMNPNLFESLQSFISGFVSLQNKINSNAPYTDFKDAYNDIKQMFTQSFYLRTLGTFLLYCANDVNLQNEVKKSLSITYGTDTNQQVISISVI